MRTGRGGSVDHEEAILGVDLGRGGAEQGLDGELERRAAMAGRRRRGHAPGLGRGNGVPQDLL